MLDNLFTEKGKTGANGNEFLEKNFDINLKWKWELRWHIKEYGNQKNGPILRRRKRQLKFLGANCEERCLRTFNTGIVEAREKVKLRIIYLKCLFKMLVCGTANETSLIKSDKR